MLPAFALLLRTKTDQRALLIAGLLLGIGVLLRFQFGVAAAFIVLATCWQAPRDRLLPVIIGGSVALIAGAIVDMTTGQLPFGWLFSNIYQNIIVNRSADFGVSSAWAYFGEMGSWWGWGRYLILVLLIPAYRANKILVCTAVINLAAHMAVGQKEYRFILLSTTILVIVAALGSVDVAKWLTARVRVPLGAAAMTVIVLWSSLSLSLALREPMRDRWTGFSASLLSVRDAGKISGACGLGVTAPLLWYQGGYTWFHRNAPIIMLGAAEMSTAQPAFNVVVAPDTAQSRLGARYTPVMCRPAVSEVNSPLYAPPATKVCLYQRPGPCDFSAHRHLFVNDWLRTRDQ